MKTLPASRLLARIQPGSHTVPVRRCLGLIRSASSVWTWPAGNNISLPVTKTAALYAVRSLRTRKVKVVNVYVSEHGVLALL